MSRNRCESWHLLLDAEEAMIAQNFGRAMTVAEQALLLANNDGDSSLAAHAMAHQWLAGGKLTVAEQALLLAGPRGRQQQPLWDPPPAEQAAQLDRFYEQMAARFGSTTGAIVPPGWGAAATPGSQRGAAARLLLFRAGARERERNYAEASALAQQSLDVFNAIHDVGGQARATHQLAILAHRQGHLDRADGLFRRAFDMSASIEDADEQAAVLTDRSAVLRDLRRFEEAVASSRQALELHRSHANRAGEGICLLHLGDISHEKGDDKAAIEHYAQATNIFFQIKDRYRHGVTLNQLGNLYSATGPEDMAVQCLEGAVSLFREVNQPREEAESAFNLAFHFDQRDPSAAQQWAERSLAAAERLGDQRLIARNLLIRGGFVLDQGDLNDAWTLLHRGLTASRAVAGPDGEAQLQAQLLVRLGVTAIRAQSFPQAEPLLTEAARLCGADDPPGRAMALHWLGLCCCHQNKNELAVSNLMEAFTIREQIGSPEKEMTRNLLKTLRQTVGEEAWAALWQQWDSSH